MKTVCVFPSGTKKIWDINPDAGPIPAKDVYIGPFAKKCKEYVGKFFPDSWWILSSKYGFLYPDEIVPEPYNVSFDDPNSGPIPIIVLAALALNKYWREYERIVVLGGRPYVEICNQVFPGKEIYTPLINCKTIDQMIHKLNKAIIDGREL